MKVLGVITARAGSKGLPGKNVKLLAGKPLLAYTVEAARASSALDALILSTEDEQIADVGRQLGCDVPFIRPRDLAQDDTPHLPVIQHAVRWMAERAKYSCDAVMILQPTSPLRTADDIRSAIDLLERSGADSVVSASEVPAHVHPMRTLRVDQAGAAVLFVTTLSGPAKTPWPPLLRAPTRSMRASGPVTIAVSPIPTIAPFVTAMFLRFSALIPRPTPGGLHVGGVPEQEVGPLMRKPFRSMVTSLTVTEIAVVSGSGTVRLLDRR